MRREAAGVWKVSYRLNSSFCEAIKLLYTCKGSAIITGMGKAGLIGQKIAATLSSTGTPAHFLHPAEAFHGDLGRVHPHDVVVMLTQSGETAEVTQLLPSLREFGVPLIAITAARTSSVGRAANVVIELGDLEEVCSLGLAPSTSTTAMLAVGDALALVLSKMRNFQADDFARFHPGGALGRKLSKVDDIMRPLAECRTASDALTVRQVIVKCTKPGRRSGAIMLTDKAGRLTGLFTDSDLARFFEKRDEAALDRPMCTVMVASPPPYPAAPAWATPSRCSHSENSASCRWSTKKAGRSGWSTSPTSSASKPKPKATSPQPRPPKRSRNANRCSGFARIRPRPDFTEFLRLQLPCRSLKPAPTSSSSSATSTAS